MLGFRLLGLRVLGFKVLGFRVLGFSVLGFSVLGFSVLGFGHSHGPRHGKVRSRCSGLESRNTLVVTSWCRPNRPAQKLHDRVALSSFTGFRVLGLRVLGFRG